MAVLLELQRQGGGIASVATRELGAERCTEKQWVGVALPEIQILSLNEKVKSQFR